MSYGYPVGAARAFFGLYDNTGGYLTGVQSTLSNGAVSGPYVLNDIKTAAENFAQSTDLQIQGGDKIVAVVSWSQPRLVPFDITSSSVDTTLISLLNGSTTNTTSSVFTKFGYNSNRAFPRPVFVAIQQRFVDATSGADYWITRVIPKGTAMIRSGGAQFRGESDSTIHVTANFSNVSYTGQTFGSSGLNMGFEGDKTDYYDLVSPDPITFLTYRSDASATTFTGVYRPLSTTVTLNATPNELVIQGAATATAFSSVNTTTSVFTLSAAGSAGNYYTITYTTAFTPT